MNRLAYTTREISDLSPQEKTDLRLTKGRLADSERLKYINKRQSLTTFLKKYDR